MLRGPYVQQRVAKSLQKRGIPMILRHVTMAVGPEPLPNPPDTGRLTLAQAAPAGASYINIACSGDTRGRIVPGDAFSLGAAGVVVAGPRAAETLTDDNGVTITQTDGVTPVLTGVPPTDVPTGFKVSMLDPLTGAALRDPITGNTLLLRVPTLANAAAPGHEVGLLDPRTGVPLVNPVTGRMFVLRVPHLGADAHEEIRVTLVNPLTRAQLLNPATGTPLAALVPTLGADARTADQPLYVEENSGRLVGASDYAGVPPSLLYTPCFGGMFTSVPLLSPLPTAVAAGQAITPAWRQDENLWGKIRTSSSEEAGDIAGDVFTVEIAAISTLADPKVGDRILLPGRKTFEVVGVTPSWEDSIHTSWSLTVRN